MDREFQLIGKNIKYLREKKGYTQEELAEAANLSTSHLSKVESGQRRIGMKAYLSILQILETSESELSSIVAEEKEKNDFIQFKRSREIGRFLTFMIAEAAFTRRQTTGS